ncbi:MAG: hypothetical protein M5U14_04100 [Acidimicrobiia bacterium]|nr:hypothetical protein [Acidimicrobiia bacterium]
MTSHLTRQDPAETAPDDGEEETACFEVKLVVRPSDPSGREIEPVLETLAEAGALVERSGDDLVIGVRVPGRSAADATELAVALVHVAACGARAALVDRRPG